MSRFDFTEPQDAGSIPSDSSARHGAASRKQERHGAASRQHGQAVDGLAGALRVDLAGYTPDAIDVLIGPEAAAALEREQRLPALRAARASEEPLALQVRALMLRDPLPRAELERAFPASAAQPEAFEHLFELVQADEACAGATPGLVGPDVAESALAESDVADPLVARFQIRAIAVPDAPAASGRAAGPVAPAPGAAGVASDAARDQAESGRILLASDWGELVGLRPDPEHVMPVGGATRSLMALAEYHPGQRVLDIGTGCGVHAILAAKAGARVTATDISARALGYARLNAALAGVALDLREGSLLEPVAGERYDVVVSNPPFVITPQSVRERARYTYRDGGMPGDSLVKTLLTGLPEVLAPGGRAWMLANWEVRDAWDEPLRAWTEGLEAWAICREELSPGRYAEMWLRDGGLAPGQPGHEEAYGAWVEDFEARGVRGVAMGFLLLGAGIEGDGNDAGARVSGASEADSGSADGAGSPAAAACDGSPIASRAFRRFERISGPMPGAAKLHAYTERVWANRALTSADDAELAGLRLRAVDALEQRLHMPGAADPFLIKLTQLDAFGEEVQLTTAGAAAIGACDGELTLGQISQAVVAILGAEASADPRDVSVVRGEEGAEGSEADTVEGRRGDAPEASPLIAGLGDLVRRLIGLGMLVPAP